jgi:hypothetical protein
MHELLEALIDKQEASSFYDGDIECTVFPNGEHWARCTFWARGVEAALGADRVKVIGFSNDENPTAEISKPIFGHDFALVDERFIVDGWAKYVASHVGAQPGVYDLDDEKDADVVRFLYGDRDCWTWLDDPGPRITL